MIRLLIDKTRSGLASPAVFKNVSYLLRPLREPNIKYLSTQIYSPAPGTNLAKDIIVYKSDNKRFYQLMNIFAISQFFFWGYLGHWSFTSLRDTKISEEVKANEDLSWWRKTNLGEGKYRNTLAVVCFVVAYAVIFVSWTYTLRSVRYLIALKNGKDVSLVTYTPFGANRILNVPINCISAQESRKSAKIYLPLKVKNKAFFYILDMKGTFTNTKLFDNSIGLNRKF